MSLISINLDVKARYWNGNDIERNNNWVISSVFICYHCVGILPFHICVSLKAKQFFHQRFSYPAILNLIVHDSALEASKWPSLRIRRDEHILKLVRKCIDGNKYFIFNKYIYTHSTR